VLEVLRTGEPISGVLNRKQLEATVASGTESFFKYFFSPIKDPQGRVVEVVKFIADVTDLETAKRRAEEASRVKSDFLAKMSHEIRTPMNSILGMLRLALLDELPGKQRERLQVAKESADSLLGLLNDLLDLSKIEAGRFSLQHMDFSLAKILNNVVREFRPEAQEKGLWLDLHLSDGLPERVEGDPQRLRQILINLISNALKCTHQGGVTVEAERNGHLEASASEDSRSVELVFRVSDTGVGIDPDWADRIFESYEQCGFASSPEQGTGLGLAICNRLIQEMNGRIWVESKPGSGSTFVFALPFVRDGSDSEAKEKTAAQIIFPELPSLHILLVEDERMNQIFTQDLLASSGHSVDLAQNGQEALDMLRRKSYDAVLMDVKMPVMDGVEATLRIRTSDPWEMNPDIPVIGLSAHAVSKDKEQRFFNPGFNAYITKPVEFEKLFETLSEVISGRELLARQNVSHRDTD
jgi:signal transduction histidine kinase/CheY-like chemotaxis protein